TDPGAVDGAAAGLHALVGGSLVRLDGQRAPRVAGSFGQMPGQTAAALSRTGQVVASIVTLRPGAPDMASSLWVGPLGGSASQAMDGRSLSRPSWSLDDAIWVVVDGNNVVRVIQDASGQPARIPVDSTAVSTRFPGPIAELQLSRDGTRAAIVIEGRLILAGVEQTTGGGYALTYPRRLAYGLRDTVVSLSWRTGDDIVVSRTDAQNPVAYVNLDGVNSDGPSRNLLMPVTTVAANPSAVYVADERGVLQLSGSAAESDPGWAEVRPLMAAGALPVLPG
ncbi:MAG: LpqB family beta-propeller domain-containing protein, partial [Mycobacterium sp.]